MEQVYVTVKRIICLDGEERMLEFYTDGRIYYCKTKNGKSFGRSFILKRDKLPTWLSTELLINTMNTVKR